MAQSSTPARDGEANGSPMSTSSPPAPAAAPATSSNRVPQVRLRLAFPAFGASDPAAAQGVARRGGGVGEHEIGSCKRDRSSPRDARLWVLPDGLCRSSCAMNGVNISNVFDRINASVKHVRGIERPLRHTYLTCRACMMGGTRKPSTKQPTSRQFSYYG
eukprot:3064866-Pleurochrysis_carterae.AAC.1